MQRDQFLDLAKSMLLRAANADFLQRQARDDERAELAAANPPVANPQVQDYLAWRRAALWVAGIVTAIAFGIAAASHESMASLMAKGQGAAGENLEFAIRQVEQNIGKDNLELMDGLNLTSLGLKLFVAVLAILAARHWSKIAKTRLHARWAFAALLIVPLGMFAFPWAHFMDFKHLDALGGNAMQVKQGFAVLFGSVAMLTLAPKLLSLFPGVIRASLTLKTLLPEAAAPGWVAVIFAPLFLGFLLLVLCLLSQLQGNFTLILAFVALALGPVIYLRRAKDLVQPHDTSTAGDVIRSVRRSAMTANALGLILLVVYLVELDAIDIQTVVTLILEALGSVLLTMVVFTDTMLALLRYGSDQGDAFQGSALQASLRQRLQALTDAGLTDTAEAFRLREKKSGE
jgi:hypothetical protein